MGITFPTKVLGTAHGHATTKAPPPRSENNKTITTGNDTSCNGTAGILKGIIK